jgi:DNA-binding NtrC family response regulator
MTALRLMLQDPFRMNTHYEMVGESAAMRALFKRIAQVSCTDLPVLITGESGTGKELIANAIYHNSTRADAPFVTVNCGALALDLIQSEPFDRKSGVFTGAHRQGFAHLDAAAGGTVFLDEIGDLPHERQFSILHFLEQHVANRAVNTASIPVDLRVIAATHGNLQEAIIAGRFRQDLYYRLNVFPLHAPRLADRGGDIELLARYFFSKYSADCNTQVTGFSLQAFDALNHHSWPGNVRELSNRVRRGMITCERMLIQPRDLGLQSDPAPRKALRTLSTVRDDAERNLLLDALRRSRGNVSNAASQLDVSRMTMYRLMRKHAIHNV